MALFSQTTEYALRAVVHIAACGEGASQTVGQIAAGTQVPSGYLSKVLQSLGRAGLIVSQRGLGGGFRLARAAQGISVLEVMQAIDPIERIHYCPLGLEAHGTRLCPLHKRMDHALCLIEEQFRSTTIAELLEETPGADCEPFGPHLCAFPLRAAVE